MNRRVRQTATVPPNPRRNDGLSHTIHACAPNPFLRVLLNLGEANDDGKRPDDGPFMVCPIELVEIAEVLSPDGRRIETVLHLALRPDGRSFIAERDERFVGIFPTDQLAAGQAEAQAKVPKLYTA